jgi:hypothetical protein
MVQQPSAWASATQPHVQRFDGEVPVVHRAQCPANDVPRKEVDDDGQKQPRVGDSQLCGIADPTLIRLSRGKVSTQKIRRYRQPVVAVGSVLEAPPLATYEPVFLHQSHDALSADVLVLLLQRAMHPWAAVVGAPFSVVRLMHQQLQSLVFYVVGALRATSPRIVASPRY